MTNHVPLCPVCNENEVGTFLGSDEFCSSTCERIALDWDGSDNYQPSGDAAYDYDEATDPDFVYSLGIDAHLDDDEMAYQDDYMYEDHATHTFDY